MTEPRISVAGPWITELEVERVADAVRTGWYDGAGRHVAEFERAFARYTDREYGIALPSCTSGLHLTLAALGIGPGHRVAVPDVTWIATSAPISYVGATPVFVDVDPVSWCLSAEALEPLLPELDAVIAVDLYGAMPDYPALESMTSDAQVPLVEDAAEAIGSRWGERRAGGFGVAAAFSFHGSKTLTTGEGGMLVTDSAELLERCRFLADHGRMPGDTRFANTEVAFKYKMSAMQAALGLAQLERVEDLVQRKREIFGWYRSRLGDRPDLELNVEPPGALSSYWMVTVLIDRALGLSKFEVIERMAEAGIDCRPMFSPLSSLEAYRDAEDGARAREANSVSYDVGLRGVNLPSGLNLTEDMVERVCITLRDVLA
ncbi:MAG: perosamine synthetase [Solirubrobacteraceae bacterium]|jgi:perosamine synthetase|nr:perosamine synthetase [Solirubrobacteraceae bacterium]